MLLHSGSPYAQTGWILAAACLLAAPASAKRYEAIKGESSLVYVLDHPMHLIKGVNRDFECKVDLSDDTLSSRIWVAAEVKKFDSGNSSRDSHALEAVDALKFPLVTFESRSIKPEGAGYAVSGILTFHGQSHPVTFPVLPAVGKERVEITGTFDVNLSDYGVKPPGVLFFKVKDKMTLRFDLVAPL